MQSGRKAPWEKRLARDAGKCSLASAVLTGSCSSRVSPDRLFQARSHVAREIPSAGSGRGSPPPAEPHALPPVRFGTLGARHRRGRRAQRARKGSRARALERKGGVFGTRGGRGSSGRGRGDGRGSSEGARVRTSPLAASASLRAFACLLRSRAPRVSPAFPPKCLLNEVLAEGLAGAPSSKQVIGPDIPTCTRTTFPRHPSLSADSPAKKEDVLVLSDLPEVLFQEFHHPQDKPLVCFYSISDNYFVSFNWIESYRKQKQIILWIQDKDETSRTVEKKKFPMMDQVPPIEAMVHTGSYHMLIAYCGDMCLRLFGDHHRAFRSLCTVPCQFSINCLCYDSETEMLLSGTLGAVVTWLILPGGKGLQMAQTVSIPSHEFVQGFSLHGPQGSLLVLCENTLRAFAHQGPGQLEEVKKFTPVASGSPITCSYTCIPRGYLYAGNKTGEVHAWSLDHDHFLHSFQAHSSSVICVHSRPDMYTLLTAGSEGTVREWTLTSGDLLRQLDIDEELKQLQFIDNNTFFCQTNYTFSLYHLPYFYSLFSVCGSAPQLVQRVCCGPNWARILCATEDGLWRFLSPVTGELLLITWPLLLDKTEVWAYDSDREELFVATRSSDVLVFDATRSPCTAKYLMCMSVNAGDSITCLLYGKFNLGKDLQGLILCGHESGMVRTLSHYSCARIEETLHSGAVLALSTLDESPKNSLLCSYGMDSFVHLIEVTLQGYKVILKSLRKIFSSCPLKHVILLPSSVGAITENLCWRLWYHQDFLGFSGPGQGLVFRETKRLHQCAITSFDVCLSLNIFVTGAIDGSVRIWNFHGKLITELNSVLPFGPLCFANNHGDLLLTFNQSLYLVSCLKLLPPGLLTHLVILNMADEIQEVPRPFMPSFFFSFETVFVPKFVYLGHGLQELQGLETLVNQRAIAFDNSVPHVVEEETSRPQQSQRSKGQFLEEKETDQSEAQRPPRVAPARLLLTGWDGLNPYRILRSFFGRDRHWPFAPDGYIPNSVVRARLWPEGTPIFLRYDMHAPCQKEAWAMTEPFRGKAPSPLTLEDEKDSAEELVEESQETKGMTFGALLNMTNQNWVGRKFSEELIDNLIEAVLNLTIYCSAEKYKKYLSILAHVLGTSRVRPRSLSLVASRLLDDTTHYNPHIRVLAWEGLDRLGLMNHLFAIPLAMNLMDSDERVRIKALYLMTRVAGVRTKSMLVRLLKTRETWKELQQKRIGEESMSQLFGVQGNDIQALLVHVEEQLNENLSLSHKEQQCAFPAAFDIPDKPTLIHKSKIKKQLQIKSKRIRDERAAKEPPIIPGKEAIEEAGTLGIKEHESKKAVTKSKVSPPKVKKKKVPPSREDLGLETVASTKKRRKLAAQEGGMPEKERKLPGEKKTVQEKRVPAQTKLSPLQGEMPRGEITKEKQASSPKKRQLAAQEKKKFLRRVKKMVWNERKSARDRKKPAWRKRAWNQEEGKGVWAKEAGLPVSEGRKLAQEGEELAKGKKEPGKEKKVAEEKEDLLVNIEKQVRELQEKPHKKGPYTQGEGRDAEDKEMPPWKRADLAQEREHLSKDNLSTEEEGLSWEERTQALEKESMVEEDNELAPQQERLLGKEDGEAHGMKEAEQGIKTQGREEEEQEEEQGQEESPIPEGEREEEEEESWEGESLSEGEEVEEESWEGESLSEGEEVEEESWEGESLSEGEEVEEESWEGESLSEGEEVEEESWEGESLSEGEEVEEESLGEERERVREEGEEEEMEKLEESQDEGKTEKGGYS
ncbi:WD repeat-containing protein 87-like [Tenrec ecaudatus]|uniref:WD repeat-containing protein 87-like n=1 Tax=Tenrec ecaudatus TaxID=94439 RepID=UPI003F59950F